MASTTSRIFFTLTIPSVFGFLTFLWYYKKRTNSSTRSDPSDQETFGTFSKPDRYEKLNCPSELRNSLSPEDTVRSEMQLKETESDKQQQSPNCNGVAAKHHKSNGVANAAKAKFHENGASCSTNGSASNGRMSDNSDRDNPEKITNGVEGLSLNGAASELNGLNGVCKDMEACNGLVISKKPNLVNGHSDESHLLTNGAKSDAESDLDDDDVTVILPDTCAGESSSTPSEVKCTQEESEADSSGASNETFRLDGSADCAFDDSSTSTLDTSLTNSKSEIDEAPSEIPVSGDEEGLTSEAEKCPSGSTCADSGKGDSNCSGSSRTESTSSSGIAEIVSDIEAKFAATHNGHPPEEDPSISPDIQMVYEFEIRQQDCGRLIGKNGQHVNWIRRKTNACVMVKVNPYCTERRSCLVSGTAEEIDAALKMIRRKFPIEQYPNVTLSQVNGLPFEFMHPDALKLLLPEGVAFEAILCATVTPGHFFLQQPTHPSYHSLAPLTVSMTNFYNQEKAPLVDNISKGNIVAVDSPGIPGWFRAEVVEVHPEQEQSRLKYLDYGGFAVVKNSAPRQITFQFMQLPFQAAECYLAGVAPADGDHWSPEAKAFFEELAQGQFLQGYIVAYAPDRVPYVNLYKVTGASSVFINNELIQSGYAREVL